VWIKYVWRNWLSDGSSYETLDTSAGDVSSEHRAGLLELSLTEPLKHDADRVRVSGTIRPNGAAFEDFIKAYFLHELVDPG